MAKVRQTTSLGSLEFRLNDLPALLPEQELLLFLLDVVPHMHHHLDGACSLLSNYVESKVRLLVSLLACSTCPLFRVS